MTIDLTQMQPGESDIVSEIHDGHGLIRKFKSMGIGPEKKLPK